MVSLTNRHNWIRQLNNYEQLIGNAGYKIENESGLIFNNLHSLSGVYRSIELLTKKEKEILFLVGEGKSNIEIAGSLFISIRTVDTHKTNMIKKLGFKSTRELYAFALEIKTVLKNF